ncbi:virB8 family protein [Achromobacter spanius]|uniref:virB8 family protein n=1 Tax=Achromobacter spanius TaxID=217203 RepID=UPI00381A9F3B
MSSEDPKLSLQQELDRNRGLDRDLLTEFSVSRTKAWRVATGFFVLAALAIIALAALMLSYTPQPPYVVRVNEATGEVENVSQVGDAREDYGPRLARYFVTQYVLSCEGYDWRTLQNMYDRCGLFSSPDVQKQYHSKFEDDPRTGREALDKKYGEHTRLAISVRSITPGPNQTATVRFTRSEIGPHRSPNSEQFIATLAYRFVNTPMSESVIRDNPLGFQVISYSTAVETLR